MISQEYRNSESSVILHSVSVYFLVSIEQVEIIAEG